MSGSAESKQPRPPGRLRRALEGGLVGLGFSVVFLAAAVGSVVIHLDLPPTRRLILTIVNDALAKVFEGQIIADEIDRASLAGVDIRSAVVLDPKGAQVIRASGIHARADVLGIVYNLFSNGGPIWIDLPWVRVDDAVVLVEREPGAALPTVAEAFLLRGSATPPAPGQRGVRVDLNRIEIGHAWAHGLIAAPRALDADISHVVGALHLGATGLTLDVEQTGITDRALLPAQLTGSANYHLRLGPTPPRPEDGSPQPSATMSMWTVFAGQLGAVEVQVRGGLDEHRLTATAEIPRATPAQLATVIPDLPIHEALSATIVLDGDIPTFAIHGDVAFEGANGPRGKAEIEGRVDITHALRFEADVAAHAVDPAIFATIAATPVDAAGRLKIELGPLLRLQIDASTTAFAIGADAVPAADLHLVLDRGMLSGNATLYEEGAPIDATFALSPGGALAFAATSDVASLRAVPRIAAAVDGSAHVKVTGTLRAGVIDAKIAALYSGLRAPGGVEIEHGGLDGHVNGSTSAPGAIDLDATVWGRQMKASGYVFDRVNGRAHGPLARPQVTASLLTHPPREGAPDDDPTADGVQVSGTIDAAARGARDVKLRVRRDGTEVLGSVAKIGVGAGGVRLEGVALEGAGTGKIAGGLTVRGREIVGKIHGEGVDLESAGKLLGIAQRVRGLADFDVDLQPTAHGRKGHITAQLENGELSVLTGVSALLTATFDDDKVTTDGLLRLIAHPSEKSGDREPCSGAIAQIRLTGGEGALAGHLLDPASYARLSGKVHVAADDWDLRCLARLAPGVGLVLSDVRGKLGARFDVARKPGERFASVHDLFARTAGLELAGPQPFGSDAPAWESRKLDVQVSGDADGVTGESRLRAALFDGELVADASVAATLDFVGLVDRPKDRWALLRKAPLSGKISVPRRRFSSFVTLPSFMLDKIPALSGEIGADAYVDGTLDQPFFTARVSASRLAVAQRLTGDEATPWSLPLDAEVLGTYDAEKATIDVHVKDGAKEVATANGEVTFDLRKLLAGGAPTYTAGFYAKLDEVPLGEVPWFADHDVGGHMSGTVSMSGLHEHPEMKVDLTLPDLKIGADLFFSEGALKVDIAPPTGAAGDHSTARVQAHLAAQDGGLLDASAFAGVLWKGGLVPTLDAETAADFYAKAQSLRLAVFHPGVADILSKLDGYLDGDVRVGWKRLAAGDRASIDAKMTVKSGVIHVPQIGQELHDATITIESKPDGTIELKDIRAEGTRGRITGSATAHLDGLRFERGGGSFEIKKGEEIPLTLEGVPLGNAYGTIKVAAEKHDNEIRATVGIPWLHLDLPSDSARGVQSLDDNPHISVSHRLGAGKEARAEDALAWKLVFDIGRVEVAGANLDVTVSGSRTFPPTVELTDRARVSGDIELLPGGTLNFFGKQFAIEEKGLVRLRAEDTSNPYLNVQARWRGAPQGTSVFVEYIGVLQPITSDKLKFRSEPPLGQPQILAMLLGAGDGSGTFAGGVQTGPSVSAQQVAGGVAVELASSQVNALLSGTVFKGFSTQFSTNEDGTLRPGVAYAIGDKLHAAASYTTTTGGTSAAATGSNLGGNAGAQSQTVLSLDWRFLPTWLLRGTAAVGGDQPAGGLDVLWQYRY
ncbi:MAG: translocation/assembly module TamB domain-containing protein [Byssovorax sp.]